MLMSVCPTIYTSPGIQQAFSKCLWNEWVPQVTSCRKYCLCAGNPYPHKLSSSRGEIGLGWGHQAVSPSQKPLWYSLLMLSQFSQFLGRISILNPPWSQFIPRSHDPTAVSLHPMPLSSVTSWNHHVTTGVMVWRGQKKRLITFSTLQRNSGKSMFL